MNRSCKHSDILARPKMSMATSANAMLTHTSLSAKDRRCTTLRQMVETPLFIKDGSCHDLEVLQKLSNMARHMLIQQSSQRKSYTVLCCAEREWYVLRNYVSPTSEFQSSSVAGMTPPAFKSAWHLELNENGILSCNCGYKQQHGIPCRHLFCVEDEYELSDFSVRWQVGYSYYAFVSEFPRITESYMIAQEVDHQGIQMKTDSGSYVGPYPYIWSGTEYTVEHMLGVINSPVPLCWNYGIHEYPKHFQEMVNHDNHDSDEDDQCDSFVIDETEDHCTFTQESVEMSSSFQFAMPQNRDVTHGQLLTMLKDMLPLFNCQPSRQHLLKILHDARTWQSKRHAQKTHQDHKKQRNIDDNNDNIFLSSNVPFDTAKRSTQNTYRRNRLLPK